MNDDSTLVLRAKAGDYAAFEQLVSHHTQRLYMLAMHLMQQREDAEDVVQITFLRAAEHLTDFRKQASFATWITRIAVNTALKMLRQRQQMTRVSLEQALQEEANGDIPHPSYIADWRNDPAHTVEQHELQRILTEAMDVLPTTQRVVFVLRDVIGMTIEETAQTLGISPANVKVRLLRARLALRETLTRVFGDERKRVFRNHRHEGDEHGATPVQRLLRHYQKRRQEH
jgi:RNA polymerase sigma-70 factor (ECF subfamily)